MTTNNWTFIQKSFYTGSTTQAQIGFYSDGVCFDLFRLTCSPLLANEKGVAPPKLEIAILENGIVEFSADKAGELRVLDQMGRVCVRMELGQGRHAVKQQLSNGIYNTVFTSNGRHAIRKFRILR